MKSHASRAYRSPARDARTLETRERILASVAAWMERDERAEFTIDAVAREAGVERRTVFRHFETKEVLLEAFWAWVNVRLDVRPLPTTLDELIAAPRSAFPAFDTQAGVIRASLHTPAGRVMRTAVVARRRRAFTAALDAVTKQASPTDRRRLTAVAHALYSAAAWETMHDYAGVTGAHAGDAASWALGILVDALRSQQPSHHAPHPSKTR